jgi:hypothetical protein
LTEDDVLDEIVLILRDAVGELGDGRTHPIAAMQRAQVNSSQRAIARGGIEPTESTAQAIAWWLVDRARLRSEQDAFAVALAASERTDAADPLTRELIGFVRGTVNREISLEDFWVRIRRAQREAERTREGAVFKLTPAPDAIDVADAEQVLRTMLGEAGVDLARPDIRRI